MVTEVPSLDSPDGNPWDSSAAIPGDVVRKIVALKEAEISELLRDLEEALREAEEAERLFGEYSFRSLLGEQFKDADATFGFSGATLTTDLGDATKGQPRTTVVSRPGTEQAGSHGPAVPPLDPTLRSPSPVGRGKRSGWWSTVVTSHLVVKVGIVVTLIALALLKFG